MMPIRRRVSPMPRWYGSSGTDRSTLAGSLGRVLVPWGDGDDFRLADLDRVAHRILAPFEPATVVDGDPLPALEVGVEPGLAGPPAGPAVEGDPLVGGDPGLVPVGRDLGVRTPRVVDVAVVLHVIGVGAAVA